MCCVFGFVVCCYYGHECAVPGVYNRKQIADMFPENHLTCGALWTRGANCSHGAVAARCPRWSRCPRRALEPRGTRLARRPAVSLWPRGSDRSDEAGDALSWGAHWPDGAWLSRGASLSVVTSVAWRSRNSLQAHHAGRAGATASPLGSGKPHAVLARHARKARCPVGTRGSRRAWRPSVALGAHRPCLVLPGGTGRTGRANASGRRSVLGRLRLFRGSDGICRASPCLLMLLFTLPAARLWAMLRWVAEMGKEEETAGSDACSWRQSVAKLMPRECEEVQDSASKDGAPVQFRGSAS
jgi:hypothetical protein